VYRKHDRRARAAVGLELDLDLVGCGKQNLAKARSRQSSSLVCCHGHADAVFALPPCGPLAGEGLYGAETNRDGRGVASQKFFARSRPPSHRNSHQHRTALPQGGGQNTSAARRAARQSATRCIHVSRCQTAQIVPAARLRPGCDSLPNPMRGGRSADRRTGCALNTPSGLHMTRQTRRLRGASRPIT
jgi:hypothetical protein